MLPQSDIWPKSFYTSEPSDDNIALFFFPSDARYEQDYDHLVEKMIRDELAFRAIMINAVLVSHPEAPLRSWNRSRILVAVKWHQTGLNTGYFKLTRNVFAKDHVNLKAKTRCVGSPISPLSNNVSIGSAPEASVLCISC
ncbi:hypothetical protein HAX54_042508 [Datura stramonium]|uniref:AIPP2-like SPOC-like domain-containing protein n=1 Tax=Datura stramonium TaxID=4076 RepID=A0ABS8W468_DATST|nr:hypothetical protein [Datura stramonium]